MDLGKLTKSSIEDFRTGLKKFGNILWDILLIPSPFAPVMFFYFVAPLITVYLHATNPPSASALDYIMSLVGMEWWAIPVIFIACAMIGYENRSAKVNALLCIPMLMFALLVIAGILNGRFPASSLLFPLLYMVVASWGCLIGIRYFHEMNAVKKAQIAVVQRCNSAEKRVADLIAEHAKMIVDYERLRKLEDQDTTTTTTA